MNAPKLKVSNLRKSFAGVPAVESVSFAVAQSEIAALIGPNGAGKTTTFNLINGQLQPESGQILLDGHDITGTKPQTLAHLGVARTFQITATFASMTVAENVAVAMFALEPGIFHFGARPTLTNPSRLGADRIRNLLAEVGMADSASRVCGTLAYGDLKRVELAMALAGSPQLLLMDEPTAGMGVHERRALMALVTRIARERKSAIFFTEHDMDAVFAHADRILVMHQGALIAEGRPDDIRANTLVRDVYLGRNHQGHDKLRNMQRRAIESDPGRQIS